MVNREAIPALPVAGWLARVRLISDLNILRQVHSELPEQCSGLFGLRALGGKTACAEMALLLCLVRGLTGQVNRSLVDMTDFAQHILQTAKTGLSGGAKGVKMQTVRAVPRPLQAA